ADPLPAAAEERTALARGEETERATLRQRPAVGDFQAARRDRPADVAPQLQAGLAQRQHRDAPRAPAVGGRALPRALGEERGKLRRGDRVAAETDDDRVAAAPPATAAARAGGPRAD